MVSPLGRLWSQLPPEQVWTPLKWVCLSFWQIRIILRGFQPSRWRSGTTWWRWRHKGPLVTRHNQVCCHQIQLHSRTPLFYSLEQKKIHYNDVIMSAMASQITSRTIIYSTVYSAADQRKHQSSASLAFVWGIHRWPVNSPHKVPVTRKMFPFDDVLMTLHGHHNIFISSL